MKLEWDWSELGKFATNVGNVSKLEKPMQNATKRLAKELLKWMKTFTPVDEYKLMNGWNGNHFLVTKKDGGFEVLIVNQCPYARAVNDGHLVRNRAGGEYYPVKRRIQVRSPHRWQRNVTMWYVFGHFFVERGIVRLKDTKQIEQIIMDELQKWWDSV